MSLEDNFARVRQIEALGQCSYGQRFEFTHTIPQILSEFGAKSAEELTRQIDVRISGRIQTIRRMGKAGFAHPNTAIWCPSAFAAET